MLCDVLKYQSLSKISSRFVRHIGKKYNNKITVGEYIIERFIDKKIFIGYSIKQYMYTSLFTTVNKFKNFDVVFYNNDDLSGYSALSYAKHTNNIGLILSTSTYGFGNICKALNEAHIHKVPLLLMSFYDKENESKLTKSLKSERQYLKESYTVNNPEKCANVLEYMMMLSEMQQKGPVHLNICNNILKKEIKLNKLHLDDVPFDETEDLSLLQYYEKKYNEAEIYEEEVENLKKQQPQQLLT